jgi:aspartate kinase
MPIVMKFGGTSVADAAAIENVARIVLAERAAFPVVVVSALSGVTDALLTVTPASVEPIFNRHLTAAEQLLNGSESERFVELVKSAETQVRELLKAQNSSNRKAIQDSIVSFGEILSSHLMAAVLNQHGVKARQVDARHCIITDEEHTCAQPLMRHTITRTEDALRSLLDSGVVPVLGGFIGATLQGATTTLGRGGSDYTAALIGAALKVDEIQIWTDVTGVLTADPRVVPEAQTIDRLSYSEAAELAYFGAKVLHPKTIQPAIENSIPVRICNSRLPQERGTLVGPYSETSPRTIKAIAHKTGVTIVQITSARMLGAYGFLRALFEVFERYRTVVDVVTTSEVSVSLSLDEVGALPSIVEELQQLGTVRIEKGRAIICVVGEGLRGTAGIEGRVFTTISDINVSLISQGASSINFTFAIEEERVKEAVTRLHEEFFTRDNAQNRAR